MLMKRITQQLKKKRIVVIILTFAALSSMFIYLTRLSSQITLFECENNEEFTLERQSQSQIKITTNKNESSVLTIELKDKGITMYGNEKYALTFVEGYRGQAIKTIRGDAGPRSTICNPQAERK